MKKISEFEIRSGFIYSHYVPMIVTPTISMTKKKDDKKCHNCRKEINKKEDKYFFLASLREQRGAKFLSFCFTCFMENADTKLIEKLKTLKNEALGSDWRECPYCVKKLPFTNEPTFQVYEIHGSGMVAIAVHDKCYYENIAVSEDLYYE